MHGFLKGYPSHFLAYNVSATAHSIDRIVSRQKARGPCCMLKVDVEGYETHALRTAQALLRSGSVRALQLEITKSSRRGTARETIEMLEGLKQQGFTFKQVPNSLLDTNGSLPHGSWRDSPGPWAKLPPFPRESGASMHSAWSVDIQTFSTNLIAAFNPPS
uniref:Methyltransferase FkbM domain-containing protein n=1 Tax=Haptolina ericina TaxID=156174 RepID=A0A7S3ESD7_9EUKA